MHPVAGVRSWLTIASTPTLQVSETPQTLHLSTEFAIWVAQNKRPFNIVEDPSASTLSRDVRALFVATRQRIASYVRTMRE